MNLLFTLSNLRKTIKPAFVKILLLSIVINLSSFTFPTQLNDISNQLNYSKGDVFKDSDSSSNSPDKVYDKWIFKSNNEGVDIFYKWFESEKYMIIKFDNTTSTTTVISFKPMIKCTNDLSSGNQTGKHVFLLPNRGLQLYLDFDCAGSIDADVILDKLKVIKRP